MKQTFEIWDYKIQAKSGNKDEADVYLDGTIVDAETENFYKKWLGDDTSISYRTFRNQILDKNPKKLTVHINSYGGMVYDALAMHDFLNDLRNKGVTVNTIVQGIAASAATFVALAGDSVQMSENSVFMIHNASGAIWGNVDDIERYANTIRKLNNQIVDLYNRRTGLSKEEIADMMTEETHLTAEEAKEKGFIDKITGAASFKNTIKPEQWPFKDRSVLNFYNSQVQNHQTMTTEDIKKAVTNSVTSVFKNMGFKPKDEAETQSIVDQVTDKLKGVFENRIKELEGQVSDVTAGKETAEAEVTKLKNTVASQKNQILSLQAQGGAAPTEDPTPGKDGKLTDQQKTDLAFENEFRENVGLEPLTDSEYLNLLTPKKAE